MSQSFVRWLVIAAATVAGCTSQSQMLDQKQPTAIQTALSRAQFEMNCPQATATVLSREVTQPAIQGPLAAGIQRCEFTIGVTGCGKKSEITVLCPEGGEGCFAADPGGRLLMNH